MRDAADADPVIPELVEAAAMNLVLHMTWVQSRVPGMYSRVDEVVAIADAGLGTDTFNTVCRARLQPDDRPLVRTTIDRFRRRGQPFSWWVGPGDRPRHLSEMLEDAGLVAAESEIAMAAPLEELTVQPPPDGLSIERVRSPGQIAEFAEINAENWSPPDRSVLAFYDRAREVLQTEGCPLRLYVGYLDGRAAGTAEVALSGRSAGLYNVCTRAEYRRRGVGLAMTLHPLDRARADGARLGILQASSDGVGIYRRAGFQPFGEYREFKPARPA